MATGHIVDGDLVSHQGHAERFRRLKRLDLASRVMDTAIRIPGTNIRFGADSLLGLVPGLGDVAAAAIALAIVNEARRMGMPNDKLARMLVNIAVDGLLGIVPVLGDIFDIYFKSNRRNVQMILDHFGLEELQERGKGFR